MKFREEKIKAEGRAKWIVTFDGIQYQNLLKRAKKHLQLNLEIPGFRRGKAPKRELNKRLTPNRIFTETYNLAIQEAYHFALDQKSALKPITSPEPKLNRVNDKEMVIEFGFDIAPDIKIGLYKGITEITKENPEVTEAEIEGTLKDYQQRFVMERIREADEPIQKGDEVKFDFKGLLDGEPFKGGEAQDYKLIIGSDQFVPGFESSMIGLKLGQQTIKITFPQNYSQDLGGKETEFVLKIKEIKERILPNIDEELVKDLNFKGVKTLDELRLKIHVDLLDQKRRDAKNRYVNQLITYIIKNSEMDIPQVAINQQVKELRHEFEQEVIRQGLTLKSYKKLTKLTDQDIDAEIYQDAKSRLATFLVVNEIKKIEKFQPSSEKIEEKYQNLGKQFGIDVDNLKNSISEDQVRQELENEMLTDYLYTHNGNNNKD